MKTAIVYASTHHGNTKKILDAIAAACEVVLIDATKVEQMDLSGYDAIGFASGIYYSKFHRAVLNFASANLPQNKKIFFICTYGGSGAYKSIEQATAGKNATILGKFGCKGYDTYGPFKLVGGVAKGRPNDKDLSEAVAFYKSLKLE